MKLSKTQKGIGIAAVVAAIGLFVWDGNRKRWRTFVTEGMARWVGDDKGGATDDPDHPFFDKMAFMFVEESGIQGLSEGDTIEVKDPMSRNVYPTGEMKVIATRTQPNPNGTRYWVITDQKVRWQWDRDGTHSGLLKLVKKAA